MSKREYLILGSALLLIFAVGGLSSWNVSRLQARFDASSQQSAAQLQKIADHVEQIEADNRRLISDNADLGKQIVALGQANQQLSQQVSGLRKSAAIEAAQVPSMQPTAIAQQIAALTGADPKDVASQPTGAIALSPDAAQKDLVALVLWRADHDTVPKIEKQQENLQAQLDKTGQELENLKTVLANKDKEIADGKKAVEAAVKPLNDEIKLLKAKSLKRNFFVAVGGVVAGIIVKAVWL